MQAIGQNNSMFDWLRRPLSVAAALAVAGCVGSGGGGGGGGMAGCVPNATNICNCSPTQQGVQSCTADGKGFTACVCGGGATGGDAAGSADTAGSGKAADGAGPDGGSTADGGSAGDGGSSGADGGAELPSFAKDIAETSEDAVDWSDLLDPEDTGSPDLGPPPPKDVGPANGDCPERAKIVYVVTQQNQLLSFVPDKLQFKLIGNMACPGVAGTAFSMSVDRFANAWVLFQSGFGDGGPVMKVSTENAACQATNYAVGQQGFELFGMGFSSDNPAGIDETLFIGGTSSLNFAMQGQCNLGALDTKTMKVKFIAAFPKNLGCPDMSGNGNAEVFGFFPQTNPAQVVQLDKATGQPLKNWALPAGAFAGVNAWAFAQWGGKFWLFFKGMGDATSAVWSLDPATGAAAKVLANTGYVITGAGVSSCAPTKAP